MELYYKIIEFSHHLFQLPLIRLKGNYFELDRSVKYCTVKSLIVLIGFGHEGVMLLMSATISSYQFSPSFMLVAQLLVLAHFMDIIFDLGNDIFGLERLQLYNSIQQYMDSNHGIVVFIFSTCGVT